MGLRFRKTIKLMKGLRLNVSSHGVSVTVGKSPLSFTLGKSGVYGTASIPKTGLSYRQKLVGSSYLKSLNPKLTSSQIAENRATVENYQKSQDIALNLHRYSSNVATREQFDAHLLDVTDPGMHDMLEKAIEGDPQTLDTMIEGFLASLQLPYEASMNYELDGEVMYADLDLPEIEDLDASYPSLSLSSEVMTKKKTVTTLRQEYARIVETLPIYLAAEIFNLSPAIRTIVMSARTQKRNRDGDPVDSYLLSVKFTRDIFEVTDLQKIDNPYEFINRFVNRINVSSNYSFKAITPYQKDDQPITLEQAISTSEASAAYVQDAVEGLKSLGYKSAEINRILPQLREKEYQAVDECLKEALRLLNCGK
ncbi:MAG: DUF4236 domain-containing protein [Erysipelotrichaceae bacterium]|nr:DUF4236 domain-containing protein [Erysipelotrichaceae bacterium]